jgi:LPS-assembly lipoprotein
MPWSKALRLFGLLLLATQLSSCGFKLRGDLPLQKYPAIYLQGDKHSELLTLLGKQLSRNEVKLLPDPDSKAAIFQLDEDSLSRRALTIFPNGQVAEYELIYKVKYQLLLPGEEPKQYQLELNRDYQDDPDRALAKSKELDMLLTELRGQAVARILRQLGRL